jgi:hypothetical protein
MPSNKCINDAEINLVSWSCDKDKAIPVTGHGGP